MKLRYFSHSAFQVTTKSGIKILIDPFLDGNPTSPVKSEQVEADYIILTHAHGDHFGDSLKIAKRCNSKFIAVFELANYLESKGFEAHPMHIGGSHQFEFGKVKLTMACHGAASTEGVYTGLAAGIILSIEGINIYHTGDTGLFYDMKLIGEMTPIDYMLLPIGDNFTMGITDAVKAVELTNPKCAIPIHYNTFPVIESDPEEFKKQLALKGKECIVLQYGTEIEL
jgi:L-ascorbate metabolism protein UlaG (beta-lactamase superfamily)